MSDRFAVGVHAVLLLAVIAATVVLALFHLIAGTVALAVIAGAGGIVGGSGASLVGGNLALRSPEQPTPDPAPIPSENPPATPLLG